MPWAAVVGAGVPRGIAGNPLRVLFAQEKTGVECGESERGSHD